MPRAKTIAVQGTDYQYLLKGTKGRVSEETGKIIRLIVELEKNKRLSMTFESLNWTHDHEHDVPTSIHKNSFTPADIHRVISVLEFHQGKLPDALDLPHWKLRDYKLS